LSLISPLPKLRTAIYITLGGKRYKIDIKVSAEDLKPKPAPVIPSNETQSLLRDLIADWRCSRRDRWVNSTLSPPKGNSRGGINLILMVGGR
jgi:hypothetical protein